jgi:hypothetical protein
MTDIITAAKDYIANGLAVYPVDENKRALIRRWNNAAAFRDTDRAETYFSAHPDAGIGIACGAGTTSIVVVDVDPKNGGDTTFRRLVHDVGYGPFEDCPQVITPSGGLHCWFLQPVKPLATRPGGLGEGVDVIGHRNGVVAPPSRRSDGNYAWRTGQCPDLTTIPVLPESLIDRITTERRHANAVNRVAHDLGGHLPPLIPVSQRNDVLMRAGYKAHWRHGLSEEELRTLLRELNKRCPAPLGDNEVRDMARSIADKAASTVDPSAWLNSHIPNLKTKQEFRVATTLAMIAEFSVGELTPSAELIKTRSGGMRPENYYRVRADLEERGMIRVHHRGDTAPVIELIKRPKDD